MKTHEEMIGTERFAMKTKNGSKIAVERKVIDDKEQYILKLSDNITINNMNIPKGVIFVLKKLIFSDNDVTIDGVVLVNVGLRTVWVNQNGYLHEFIGSYPIEPEEDVYSGNIKLDFADVEEISADLDLFKDMMDEGMIDATPYELSQYGLYYPQIKLYEPELDENIVNTEKSAVRVKKPLKVKKFNMDKDK
ncbi:MAG: hypothetical protein IJK66_01585 [Bacilli bacterium]|nr:hypothetical protein [Bacilli bacterium]